MKHIPGIYKGNGLVELEEVVTGAEGAKVTVIFPDERPTQETEQEEVRNDVDSFLKAHAPESSDEDEFRDNLDQQVRQ